MFSKDEIRQLVRDTAVETSRETLRGLGIDVDHPIEVQMDFAALRTYRTSMHLVRCKALAALVGVIVTAVLAAVWVGIKAFSK